MNEEIYLRLWAKSGPPPHALWKHLFDVAAACQALLPHFGGVEGLPPEWVCLLVGAHDIGKADDWFQNKDLALALLLNSECGLRLPDRKSSPPLEAQLKYRHEARSVEWVRNRLQQEHGWHKHVAQDLTHAICGHHGNFDAGAYTEEDLGRAAMWNGLREQLWLRLWSVLEPDPNFSLQKLPHAGVAGMKLSGLLVLSDWLASNNELWRYEELQSEDAKEYWQLTVNRACEVVAGLNFGNVETQWPQAPRSFSGLWGQSKMQTLRPCQSALQAEVLRGVKPGLCLIEAPMGEGKTECAFYLAAEWNRQQQRDGAYIALPTQGTSNQMHGRYREFLELQQRNAPRLVHGMAWLIDEDTRTEMPEVGDDENRRIAQQWFRPLRRALLASDGVGTVDQVLMAALHVKFGFLRLLGLDSKVLVIDEVHAYDDYMTTILERLLQWCGAAGIGVVLLSATLSHGQKKKLLAAYSQTGVDDEHLPHSCIEYPLLTFIEPGQKPREVPVENDPARDRKLLLEKHYGLLDDAAGTARLAQELVKGGGNACVLCNTVKSAQEVFQHLKANVKDGTELFLFHARFRAGERQEIEKKILARFGKEAGKDRPQRAIVVATQVVEQSLDVDFDHFISQVAPIDLLLQRSGRLHRHEPKTRPADAPPILHVLLPAKGEFEFGATEKVYAPEILLRTVSYLEKDAMWELPQDFRCLIEGVYDRKPLPNGIIPAEKLAEAEDKRNAKQQDERGKAKCNLLPKPSARGFSMLRPAKQEADGEKEANDYFRASTRLGDDSLAVLVLHEPHLIEAVQSCREHDPQARGPQRRVLEALFLQKAGLPKWWFRGMEQGENASFFEARNWLRGHHVLVMRDGEWQGHDFVIRDDKELGLQRIVSESDSAAEKHTEADAGMTN